MEPKIRRAFLHLLAVLAVLAAGNVLFIGCGPSAAPPSERGTEQRSSPLLEAPALRERVPASKSEHTEVREGAELDHAIVLKLVEGSRIRVTDAPAGYEFDASRLDATDATKLGRVGLGTADVSAEVVTLNELLAEASNFRPARLFSVKQEELEADRLEAESLSGEEMADLDLYSEWISEPAATSPETSAKLIDRLNELRIVEIAYPHYLPGAPRPVPIAPDFSAAQGYLAPAPGGIDARYAWTVPGAMGDGVRVVDVEQAWFTDHEDFAQTIFWGGNSIFSSLSPPDDFSHGAAVVGVVAAPHNGAGVRGIAPHVEVGLAAVAGPGSSVADGILRASAVLREGDILLVEQHARGPSSGLPCQYRNCAQWEYVAMENWQAEFDAIRTATARGIVVVEAAGNGSMDLDSSIYGRRFDRSYRDSHAIMVGAGTSTSHDPLPFSNWGSRVDVQGWGAGVVTEGYGDRFGTGDPNTWYTSTFGGTSSASAIVAGAAAAIQGAVHGLPMAPLPPDRMSDVLKSTGTPQPSSARHIGPLPNLEAGIAEGLRRPFFRLRPRHATYKAVDLAGGSAADMTPIWIWDDMPANWNQHWDLVPDGSGYYEIRSRVTNKCMEVYGLSPSPGAPVVQWSCWGGDNQKWFVARTVGTSSYVIINKLSSLLLDVFGLGTANGTQLIQWPYNGGDNQKFELVRTW